MSVDKSSRFLRRSLAALVALTVLASPPAALAQVENLPRLGDAAGDELSPAAERRVGEAIMREVRRDRSYDDDVELADWLNRFAAPIVAVAPGGGQSFEFFLMRDGSLNAFALPGGFIGVHTGLIAAAQAESELAGVIAHEIGHVTQRHIARMIATERVSSAWQIAALVLAALAARSAPQAAAGMVALGGSLQTQQMLGFSRDAEREADRVGIDMLRQAGFDASGMVAFFGRLQAASRLYESSAPAYLRTHPLTSERMADMQNRVSETRYRQRADSIDFVMARAKLRALADPSVNGLAASRATIERQLRERILDQGVGRFALATVAAAQRDHPGARAAIAEARRGLPSAHPFVERLAAQVELDAGDPAAALAIAQAATGKFPEARALAHPMARALLALRNYDRAARYLEESLELWRSDAALWRMLAEAYSGQGKLASAHRASAEHFALVGAWPAAIDQLRLAQRAVGDDFYAASKIDARLRELQAEHLREMQERGR